MKKLFLRILTISIIVVLYVPSVGIYFSGDDWFHLRVSQIHSIGEFVNFFSFVRNSQSITSYRPIASQIYFFMMQLVVGVNPFMFHLVSLAIFAADIYLVYRFSRSLLKRQKPSLLAAALFGISVVNFPAVYSIASIQELLLICFVLLSCISLMNDRMLKSYLFFLLALGSKETAVMTIFLLVLIMWYQGRFCFRKLLLFTVTLAAYLPLRFFVFGGVGDVYQWDFSLKKLVNTLMWYGLWGLGTPEFLVDYIASGLRVVPKFFTDFGQLALPILGSVIATITAFVGLILTNSRQINRTFLFGICFFFVSLLPVVFLPWHKFPLELGLPIVGLALALSSIASEKTPLTSVFFLTFIGLNVFTNRLEFERHYLVNRPKIAERVAQYFLSHYPEFPSSVYFEFINDSGNYGKDWGSSKQISQATAGTEMFRVLYKSDDPRIYFEDNPGARPSGLTRIPISSAMFLK